VGRTASSKIQNQEFILKSLSHFDGLSLIPQRPDYNFKVCPSSGWITSGTDQRTKHIPKTEIAGPGLKLWAAIQGLHQKKKPDNCAKPSNNHRIWESIQLTSFFICLSSLQLSPSRSPGLYFSSHCEMKSYSLNHILFCLYLVQMTGTV